MNRLFHLLVLLVGKPHILREQIGNIHHLVQIIVKHGNIPGSLVHGMHLMPLLHQTSLRPSHGNHVIIRMRAENQHPFRVRIRSFRAGRIIRVRLSSRPSRNGMLHIVKHGYIHLVGRTKTLNQIKQPVLLIIPIFHFQDRLFQFLAKPDHRLTDQFIIPLHLTHQPRVIGTSQFAGSTLVDHELHVRVHLQERCRNRIRNSPFHGCLNNRGFLLSPSHQDNPPGLHNRTHSHRNRFRGNQIPASEILYSIFYR